MPISTTIPIIPCIRWVAISKTREFTRPEAPTIERLLVTGTLAFDYVGAYPGSFDALQRHTGINVSLHLAEVDRFFGGCAINIAYSLRLLGNAPAPFAFVGADFEGSDYASHLDRLGIDCSGLCAVDGASSHAFIFSDTDGNQFTAFYPGPARNPNYAKALSAFVDAGPFRAAIAGPDIPANMIACLDVCRSQGIPVISDPGQVITDFTPADIAALIERTETLIVNEYELATIRDAVGTPALDRVRRVVVTRGNQAVRWRDDRARGSVDVPSREAVDPTGAGDAFRAGFLHADLRTNETRDAVRSGIAVALACIAHRGAQVHDLAPFDERFQEAFGESPPWLAD